MRCRPSVLTMTGKRSSPYLSARFGQSGGRMWAWVSILSIPGSLTGVREREPWQVLTRLADRVEAASRRCGGGPRSAETDLLRRFRRNRREVQILIVVTEIRKRRDRLHADVLD